MVLERIAVLVGAVEELLDLLLELDGLVMDRHKHDFLLEGIVSGWDFFRLRIFLLELVREDTLDLLDLVDRHTLSRVYNANERELRVRVL